MRLGVAGLAASPLPGPAGNVEYFLWLRGGAAPLDPDTLERVVREEAGQRPATIPIPVRDHFRTAGVKGG